MPYAAHLFFLVFCAARPAGLTAYCGGITLAILFRTASAWPTETKQLMYSLAQVLGVRGCLLFGSFVQQRPLHAMKPQLLSAALMVLLLVLAKLA